ncbi:MAG: sensor hybrid histidine kinase, partial [Verrucomicrobiales bacterium]|nr:sensor hybrid histidine kinase [Verrucomicrobiales bacterium]
MIKFQFDSEQRYRGFATVQYLIALGRACRSRSTNCIGSLSCWAIALRFALLTLALDLPNAVAQTAVTTPRTIRVTMDSTYPPYSFRSDNGKLQGILIDQWLLWEKKTGIKVELHALNWGDAVAGMRAGQFDVIDSIVETAARREYFDFTPPFTTMEVPIFFRKDISGITDLASLKGFPMGVKTGDQHIDIFKANGVTTLIPFPSHDAIVSAAKEHKINVFAFDGPSAHYFLNKHGIEGDFRKSAPIFRDQLRRAVRKGNTAMLRTVSEGFAAISPGELERIDEKWYGSTINNFGRYLTYAGYAAALAILLIAGLAGWNRTLTKRILERTAALGQSESQLRLSIDTIPTMAWIFLPDGRMEFINQRWLAYSGLSLEQALEQPTRTVHPDDLPRALEKWTVNRVSGEAYEDEMRLRRADGEYRWFLIRTVPMRDERGTLIRWYGTSTDIQDRHRAEEALRETQAVLARVTRSTVVGELTASIAHEVNQPLAAVVTNAGAALRWLDG